MKISIITTCLNAEKYIKQTIESVLSQKGDFSLEYIITDAGSTDSTLEIIKSFGDKITLLNAKGLNQSEGINLGIKKSSGDIIAYLNADDTYLPNTLSIVTKSFQNNSPKWVIGKCHIINSKNKEINKWVTNYKNFFLKRYNYFWFLVENFISQPAVFLHRDLFKEFGYFNETEVYTMDYNYWLEIGKKYNPVFIDKYLSNFRRTKETKSNTGYYKQFWDDAKLGIKFAVKSRIFLAIPLKIISFLKTILLYTLMY